MAGTSLVITVEMTDDQDFDWLRNKCVPAVESEVDLAREEGRLDGEAEVSWEEGGSEG